MCRGQGDGYERVRLDQVFVMFNGDALRSLKLAEHGRDAIQGGKAHTGLGRNSSSSTPISKQHNTI